MILYLSGNFPQLSKPEKELAMAVRLKKLGYEYCRLLTFYYKKDCKTILDTSNTLKEEYESR